MFTIQVIKFIRVLDTMNNFQWFINGLIKQIKGEGVCGCMLKFEFYRVTATSTENSNGHDVMMYYIMMIFLSLKIGIIENRDLI